VNNLLYVANAKGQSITIFNATDNGNVSPIYTITGVSTELVNPTGIALQ